MIERKATVRLEQRRALYSPCERYRYLLEIDWRHLMRNRPRASLQFIGLNPSTATELEDDATIRRCKGYARAWGFGGLRMTNLAAFRATAPRDMLSADDPIGPENTPDLLERLHACALEEASRLAQSPGPIVVACWGARGAHTKLATQAREIEARLGPALRAFGLTSAGQPMHPLYLLAEQPIEPLASLRAVQEIPHGQGAGSAR